MRIAIIAATLFMSGCAVHQPVSQNWRLYNRENARVLIPPGVEQGKKGFVLDIAAGHGRCPPGIRAKGKHTVVAVDRDSITKHPNGWLPSWADELESRGCIAQGEAPQFADSLPLDPDAGFHLRYGDDIETPVRLQVVSPMLRGDDQRELPLEIVAESAETHTIAVKLPANQLGYETALYEVQPKSSGAGFSISPVYAERHIENQVERAPKPLKDLLCFPPEAAYYRLFIKSGQTDFTALVIASPDRAGLQRDVTSCEPNDRMCVTIPHRVAINEMIPVTVNGKDVMLLWGAHLIDAIREGNSARVAAQTWPGTAFRNLSVSRPYRGRLAPVEFDRNSPDILSLVLLGGEVITW